MKVDVVIFDLLWKALYIFMLNTDVPKSIHIVPLHKHYITLLLELLGNVVNTSIVLLRK